MGVAVEIRAERSYLKLVTTDLGSVSTFAEWHLTPRRGLLSTGILLPMLTTRKVPKEGSSVRRLEVRRDLRP